MTESIKFGPEWLRNLSGDSSNSGGGGGGTANLIVPRYQLAEHRYGREEMLALFDRNCKPPEALALLQTLYVEKTQLPLAFVPMTEDETRTWSIGVGTGAVRGRGGSVDRGGRGRPGRGGMYTSHYSRGVGFDDSGEGTRLESQSYTPRNRGFDRSQSERGWTERNGVSDATEWNGSTSPRKEMTRGTSGTSLMEGNWRRQRGGTGGGGGGDDDEGWRTATNRSSSGGTSSTPGVAGSGGGNNNEKWIRGSWRDGNVNDRDRLDRSDGDIDDNRPPGRWDPRPTHRQSHDSVAHHHSVPSRTSRTWDSNHHDNHDNLPEWATENPSESGGSFDASGAFHGGGSSMFSDDDEDGNKSHEMRTRRVSEGNNGTAHKGGKIIYQSPGVNRHQNVTIINSITKERPKSLHPFDDKEPSITTTPTITTDRSSISPTKQTTNNLTKDPRRIQNSNDSTPKGPQRSKSFIDPPTKTLPQQNNIRNNKQIDEASVVVSLAAATSPSSATSSTPMTTPTSSSSSSLNHKAQLLQCKNLQNLADQKETINQIEQKPDDDDERMKEEANMLVAKLMADEENHKEEERTIHVVPPVVNQQVPPAQSSIVNPVVQEKWYYQDPQGEVQGPFLPNEMAEWCKAGYFTPGLLIRRTCDERFVTLGDLMKICGRVPFTPGPPIPPFKIPETIIPPIPNAATAGIPSSALPKPPPQQQQQIDDPLLLLQYSQLRVLHDQMLYQQAKNAATAKLSRLEQWNNLSQVEKNHLLTQCIMQDPEIREITMNASQFAPQLTPQTTNPVMQLFSQLQSGKLGNDSNHLSQNPAVQQHPAAPSVVHPTNVIGPVQHLMDQMRGMPNIPGPSQARIEAPTVVPQPQQLPPQSSQNDDPIKSLLRQLHSGGGDANGHPPQQIDSIWPHPPPQINPQFNAQNWLAQVGPMPPVPPGQMPNYLWDLPKEMKTEQQILEEQNLRLQEDRTKEELRKQEELLRKAKDDLLMKRKNEEEQKHARQIEETKRKEEQKKLKEEERLRKEEEKRRIEEEIRKKEEQIRKDNEDRKREEKRKIDEENNRKKQEEEKKRRDELKRQEEKQKKEEEKRRKFEEEQRKIEDERLKKEEEARKKLEQEENARKAEQRRREADALKKLQERSKAPWAPQATSVPTQSAASLAEIQKLEREMKAEELRYQQMMQQQLNQQKAIQAAKEAAAIDSSKRLQFKWAEKAASNIKQPQVKSLDQIQQEEQERIAKSKQQEKEKAEKSNVKENAAVLQSAGIWGTASQSLNWTTPSSTLQPTPQPPLSSSNTVDNTKVTTVPSKSPWAGTGFWDEPVTNKINTPIKQTPVSTIKPSTATPIVHNQNSQNNNNNNSNTNNNNKAAKAKAGKKEEEIVKKMFDNNSGKDEFGQWCYRTLCGLQSTIDIPTFVGFLKEIESAYEVKEYVKMYLGESKQTTEFVKQFLEKRSKLRSAQRPQAEADDLCKPAPAVNPNAPTEFQEVKGKSKKPKKGKMFKVDNTILGFSVTAATDRINVGDRDYGEGV